MSTRSASQRVALDGARRRRIYLFRHGSVDYFDSDGRAVVDTDNVHLNETGRAQALAMRQMFDDVVVDRALCSGLPRTRQTGEIVLGSRNIPLETDSGFVEIQQLRGDVVQPYDVVADVAFSHFRAGESDARFLGGERYCDFYDRIREAMMNVLADDAWHNIAIFGHGATNAAILGWVTGLELAAFGVLDQATCCLNVIDIDTDDSGQVLRKTVRAMNITAYDPAKGNRHSGDMEALARWLMKLGGASGEG